MAKAPSHGDLDTVLETAHRYEGEFAAQRLREAGIEAGVVDQSYRQEPVPSVRALSVVRVLVPAEQAGEARRILAELVPLPENAEIANDETEPEREVP